MKFWLSKNNEISLREQLSRQIIMAIVSGDLRPQDKLPSVREMALRLAVHANTVSAAYVWLESQHWVESRKGSGVFVRGKSVREIERTALNSASELDSMILEFLQVARTRGFAPAQIAERIKARIAKNSVSEILLVENDKELRRILAFEIESATALPITAVDAKGFTEKRGALVVALEETANHLTFDLPKIILRLNSVHDEMRGNKLPVAESLIGVASRWETFLSWSQTMLVAAGIAHEQIVLRDAQTANWQDGLASCAFVIADSLTAQKLNGERNVRIFRLISEQTLNEIQNLVDWQRISFSD